jgi:hypothetical protein
MMIPFWVLFIFVSILGLLIFSLSATKRGENEADQVVGRLSHVIKGLLLERKQTNAYVGFCYLEQAEDYVLELDIDKNGLSISLEKEGSYEDN